LTNTQFVYARLYHCQGVAENFGLEIRNDIVFNQVVSAQHAYPKTRVGVNIPYYWHYRERLKQA
jgi:hypothetical protein